MQITTRAIAMSTVAYITALTIGVATVATVAANATEEIPTPAVAGNYKIVVNFITGTYTVTLV